MRSVFLWRVLFVLLITVLLASFLMTGGYIYFIRGEYAKIRLAELMPEAEAIAQIYTEHALGLLDKDAFFRLIDKLMEAADSTCVITGADGVPVYDSVSGLGLALSGGVIDAHTHAALMGESNTAITIQLEDRSRALSVCVPVYGGNGDIIGSVFILQSPAEIERTISKLSRSLISIVIMVLPIMMMLSSFGMQKMMEPLKKMSRVALDMSHGDFEVRADETNPGEIGLLARALNHLCDTLSMTIHQLRAEKSQLRHILASLSEGVAATDSNGCLSIYNPALMHMFGVVRAGAREELIPDDTVWRAFDEVYRTGEPHELRFNSKNERMIWASLTPILTDEGERTGVVGLFKDMTEVEMLERARRDYVQNISHELRTPLTAIRGLLEPLSDGMVSSEDDRQRYYKIMLREVVRLSRLITDMMELSRLQSGAEYMELRKTNINEVLEDVCAGYCEQASKLGIRLELDAEKLPLVLTDADRVEQILVILLSNAMRYTKEGGTITIRGEDGPRVAISVEDTGCGIKEEDLPYLFDRFYTADKSRKEGNTGLGLSIARELIDKLGERISVTSELGKGTAFRFTLKKYVSNAIALGPARDEWQDADSESLFDIIEDAPPPEDAPYVVLDDKKPKAEKKPKQPQKKDHTKKRKGVKSMMPQGGDKHMNNSKGRNEQDETDNRFQ